MARRLSFISVGLVAFALWAGTPAANADEPYKINAILPLTGQASFLGKEEQVTLQIAEKYVNRTGGIKGRPVQFVFYDDTSSPQVGVQLVRQVSAEKPAVILGSSLHSATTVSPGSRKARPTISKPTPRLAIVAGAKAVDFAI